MTGHPELARFVEVMARLRVECPWDARQTHRSLVRYLVEETCEVIDAIETGDDDHLREELGDLLLQVVFHATIAAETGRFDIDDVARDIADKLIERHPWVFTDAGVPDDLNATWEAAKKAAKGRESALDGIPESLSALSRALKVVSRVRSHGVPDGLPADPITPEEVGSRALDLVARAQAAGIDPEQAVRDALRDYEKRVRQSEAQA
ncbi:MazG family protein [Granulicoccus sp. GXG6511]|uniref:MazG family protein n=1 Tax=Granulicoccus sp. GXG6511 TaxID=3381351 RepID=UPI003D7ECED0